MRPGNPFKHQRSKAVNSYRRGCSKSIEINPPGNKNATDLTGHTDSKNHSESVISVEFVAFLFGLYCNKQEANLWAAD
jgi:hypothetical protein